VHYKEEYGSVANAAGHLDGLVVVGIFLKVRVYNIKIGLTCYVNVITEMKRSYLFSSILQLFVLILW
jgi:Eukaryotic-type carbonic anhydrase